MQYFGVLAFCSEEAILMDMVDFLSVSVTPCQRYAVSPTQATRHRWREDHHSEPNRPTKVPLSRVEYYRPILRESVLWGFHNFNPVCFSSCQRPEQKI